MAYNNRPARDYIQKKLTTAKAAKGWTWSDMEELFRQLGVRQSSTTLTSKHSRGSFRAQDFLVMLRAMDVRFLDLSEFRVEGLERAANEVEKKKRARR